MERIEITFKNSKKCVWDKKDDGLVTIYPVDVLLSFVYFEK